MPVKLTNTSGRKILVSLDHEQLRRSVWGYAVRTIRVHVNDSNGAAVGHREVRKGTPGTLTVLACETTRELPDCVAVLPDVVSGVRRGALTVQRVESKSAQRTAFAPEPTKRARPKKKPAKGGSTKSK